MWIKTELEDFINLDQVLYFEVSHIKCEKVFFADAVFLGNIRKQVTDSKNSADEVQKIIDKLIPL